MELWELAARERIRDVLARYNWAGDSLRLDELAQTFCDDGELEVRGRDPVRGRAAIVGFLGGVAVPSALRASGSSTPSPQHVGTKRIVRHNLANTRFL
jgi:SnoaL-like domain